MSEHIVPDSRQEESGDSRPQPLTTPNGIPRREFFRLVGGAVGGFVLVTLGAAPSANAKPFVPPQYFCIVPEGIDQSALAALTPSKVRISPKLRKFVDPLPIPEVIEPTGTWKGLPLYEVEMRQFTQKLHRDLPATTLWGYNGTFPGPTFQVEQDQAIAVRWKNDLPPEYFLPRDTTLHGDEEDEPIVRTVVHLHGGSVMPGNDGYPDAWFTRNFAQTGHDFKHEVYKYPNTHEASTLWYHDHAIGVTRLNVYAGLAGLYLIHSEKERDLNLPSGAYDVPLVIQDRSFNDDGSLYYPVANNDDPDPRLPPVWVPDYFGDTILVNGTVWPYLRVEPRKYRFRILNGSNARFYNLRLKVRKTNEPGPILNVIGTDGGFLPKTLHRDHLLISPAERYDVVVDFSEFKGKTLILTNDARASYPNGNAYIPKKVMQFRVGSSTSAPDTSDLPRTMYPVPVLNPEDAVKERDIILAAVLTDDRHIVEWTLNGHWDDPITEDPHVGDIEIWRLINRGPVAHPMHLHLVHFQLLDRQPLDTAITDKVVFTGPAVKPPPDEALAWKDTIIVGGGEVARIIAKFDLPKGEIATPGQRYRYVYHCHMVEHEDNEMMRPFDIVG